MEIEWVLVIIILLIIAIALATTMRRVRELEEKLADMSHSVTDTLEKQQDFNVTTVTLLTVRNERTDQIGI